MPAAPSITPTTEADDRILHPLNQMRGIIRRFVILDGLLFAALCTVGWFWLGLVLDYGLFKLTNFDWVLDAPRSIRGIALGAFGILLIAIVVSRIVYRVTTQFSYPALALVLEKRFPKILGDRLITAVELADVKRAERAGYSPEMIRQTVEEARERLEQVPLKSIFNWQRLWLKLILILVIGIGCLGLSYPLFALVVHDAKPVPVVNRFCDVVTIWTERNVLLKNTAWPRDAYLEVIEPSSVELRVGKDATAPKIRVRASEWVLADTSSRTGWRPLRWSDLTTDFVGIAVDQSILVTHEDDWKATDIALSAIAGPMALPIEKPISQTLVDLNALTLDEVVSMFGNEQPVVAGVLARVTELAARPAMSRTLRRLEAPDNVVLNYVGMPNASKGSQKREANKQGATRGVIQLTREPNGEYSTEVTGLKESIAYTVRAKDYRTESQQIILVPPPMLTRLARVESQPAYLFHPTPSDAVGVIRVSLGGVLGGMAFSPSLRDEQLGVLRWQVLKSQRQLLPIKDFSLTGDRSICTVPSGTELELTGTADKKLTRVILTPKVGKLPGAVDAASSITLTVDGDQFAIQFVGDDRIVGDVEFDLTLVDEDGVQSKRPILIQVMDDKPPQVEIAVDVLRKVGNAYICTTRARVPFVKESIIRDDTGLSRVQYEFTVTRLEAQAVVGLQLQALMTAFAMSPVVPNFSNATGPTTSVFATARLGSAEEKQFAVLNVAPFERAFDSLRRDTSTSLATKFRLPLANPDAPNVVREVKFTLDSDVFDLIDADALLEIQGRRMRVAEATDIQPRFKMELNVVATDVNVLTGPKQGRNLEPIRLMIVSEADLLAEITKDEEIITNKFDEALRRLREAQTKLNLQADRLLSQSLPPDILLSARVRAEDITQDVAKGRDLVTNVMNEYSRLRREVEMNRCNDAVPRRFETVIIRPLEQVLATEYKFAEDAMTGFRDPLLDGRRPEDASTANAKLTLSNLIRRLEQIRQELGDSLSEGRAREELRKIIENQRVVTSALQQIIKLGRERLFAPEIRPVPPLTLTKGEQRVVKQVIDWKLFDKGEIKLRLETSVGSEITVPAEVLVKDDRNDFEYTITAGNKTGDFTVKIVPTVGPTVELKISVK